MQKMTELWYYIKNIRAGLNEFKKLSGQDIKQVTRSWQQLIKNEGGNYEKTYHWTCTPLG